MLWRIRNVASFRRQARPHGIPSSKMVQTLLPGLEVEIRAVVIGRMHERLTAPTQETY